MEEVARLASLRRHPPARKRLAKSEQPTLIPPCTLSAQTTFPTHPPAQPQVSRPRACSTDKRFAVAATRICMADERCGDTAVVQPPSSGCTRPDRWRTRLGHTAPPPPAAARRARRDRPPARGQPSSTMPLRSHYHRPHTLSRPTLAQSPRTAFHPRRQPPSRLL